MAERLSQAELARQLDVSRQAIHKLVQAGKLIVGDDGRIDKAEALTAVAHLRIDSKAAQAVPQAAPSTSAAAPSTDTHVSIPAQATQFLGNPEENGMPTNYHVARTLGEMEDARMKKLKRMEMEGQLIRVTAVEAVWAASLAQAREKLLQLSIRLSPLLAVESDPLKIDTLLQTEMGEALQVLAGCDTRPKPAEGSL